MPLINVKMVKIPASDLKRNDVFTTVLRGDGQLRVVLGTAKGVVTTRPFDVMVSGKESNADYFLDSTTTVRKVVGVKYAPATA